jgi:hypothetical protein
VIHPMQYELEQAHHARRTHAAECERLAAEVERLVAVHQPVSARLVYSRLLQLIATHLRSAFECHAPARTTTT